MSTLFWITILSTIVSLVTLALNMLIQNGVKNLFDKSLEQYKHDLSQITERSKFDYTRMNQDFNLWTTKRHEVYAKIYASVDETLRLMIKIDETEYLYGFEFITEDNLMELFKEEKISNPKIAVSLVRVHGEFIKDKVNRLISEARAKEAYDTVMKAQILFGENLLYFSDQIEKMISELFSKMLSVCFYSKYWELPETSEQNKTRLIQEINFLTPKIKELMRKELSGDYKFKAINTDL